MLGNGPKPGARYRSSRYAETLERVASSVRRLREARGWTQEVVAARAGSMSPRLYRLVESARTNVTLATLTRLAEAFDVDVAVLVAPGAADFSTSAEVGHPDAAAMVVARPKQETGLRAIDFRDAEATVINPGGEDGDARPIAVAKVARTAPLNAFVLAMLRANPRGLMSVEIADAALEARRRPGANEIHSILRSLFVAGRLKRRGRRGTFVYFVEA